MNNEKTIEEAKARAKSIFVAIALTIIGALLLAGGAYFWIMPVFEGGEPNLLLGVLLGAPGAVLEIVGDVMLLKHQFRTMREKAAAMRNS